MKIENNKKKIYKLFLLPYLIIGLITVSIFYRVPHVLANDDFHYAPLFFSKFPV